jgi:signal transduction histidine kinase
MAIYSVPLGGGQVEVSTTVKEGQAVLSVTNTGRVLPSSELNRLFEPFQGLDGRRRRHKDGRGLALSIVRAIATTHGADVSACQAVGSRSMSPSHRRGAP